MRLSTLTDAKAGAAISSRKGIGPLKHLSTLLVWVQDYVSRGDIKFKKVHTSVNVSDMMTKTVPSSIILKSTDIMNHRFETGRDGLSLTA